MSSRPHSDDSGEVTASDRLAAWEARAEPIQRRFDAEDVTEDDVAAAIEWARSE
jgi:hypothetical protein